MARPSTEDAITKVGLLQTADSAVLERLGISTKSIAPGRVELALNVVPSMTNSHGFCHGGFLFALADTAFAYALGSVGANPATLQATISFVSSARSGETVLALGEVSRAGRKAVFATVKLYNENHQLIAEFQGSGVNI